MSLITILFVVLVICVVLYLTKLLLGAFQIPNPWSTVIFVVVVLLVLVWGADHLGLATGLRRL